MTRPARGGIVVYVVVLVLLAAGAILFLLNASFTQWNRSIRTDADEIVARHLARGAVEALIYGAQLALDEETEAVPDVRDGRLGEVLLADPASLSANFAREARARDMRPFLKRLIGSKPFELIDDLKRRQPRAQLTFQTAVASLPSGMPAALVDPVLKQVDLTVQVVCTLRHARRAESRTLRIEVGSRLPGVLGRFTLSWHAMAGDTNHVVVDRAGKPIERVNPVVLFHDAADYAPVDPIYKMETGTGGRALAAVPFKSSEELERTLAPRGAAYLGVPSLFGTTAPVNLNVAAGDAPMGQNFQVFGTKPGWQPLPEELPQQPPEVASLQAIQPGTRVRQDCWIEGYVTGFHQELEQERLHLELDPMHSMPDAASWLRLSGSPQNPSVGLVYGDVRARLAAVSNLAVDRDESARDEQLQRAAGFDLPRREGDDPPLAYATAAGFASDLTREAGNAPPRHLSFLGSLETGAGSAINRNHTVVRNGRVAAVPSEELWPLITLDPGQYSYRRLFGTYTEYEKVMSRSFELPYNALLRLPGDPDQVHDKLIRMAFKKPEPMDRAGLLTGARWVHTDPLHEALGARDFVDCAKAGSDLALPDLISSTIAAPRFADASVVCYGLTLFRSSFLIDSGLDLGGLSVTLAGDKPGDPPPELTLAGATVAARGGGVLRVTSLILEGSLKLAQKTGSFEPLVIVANKLTLKGPGPFEGTFVVQNELVVAGGGNATHAVIRGDLAMGQGAQIQRTVPLAVVHDRAYDPTGPEAHRHYRGTVRTAWSQARSGGSNLIGVNPYRSTAP
jgi:hypothetical protein